MGRRDFFDDLSNEGEPEHPAAKRKNAISHSKTAATAFGRKDASREAAVFLTASQEHLFCKIRQKPEQYCMVAGSEEVFKLHFQNYTIQLR